MIMHDNKNEFDNINYKRIGAKPKKKEKRSHCYFTKRQIKDITNHN